MDYSEIHKHVRCCTCDGELKEHPFFVQLKIPVTWKLPTWGNLLDGSRDMGVAYICDGCAGKPFEQLEIKNVIEFIPGNGVVYHAIDWKKRKLIQPVIKVEVNKLHETELVAVINQYTPAVIYKVRPGCVHEIPTICTVWFDIMECTTFQAFDIGWHHAMIVQRFKKEK